MFQVIEETGTVTVNSIEIEIQSAKYQPDGGSEVDGTVQYKKQNETASFTFPSKLPVILNTFLDVFFFNIEEMK